MLGFLPVSGIALHSLGWMQLSDFFPFAIFPCVLLLLFFLPYSNGLSKIVLAGWLSGLLAVFVYDLSRLPFMIMGWGDFIPRIGGWLTNTNETNFLAGYLWRYFGNGGGMGMAFFILLTYFNIGQKLPLRGLLFGLFIYAGLMSILLLSPIAQQAMFKLTPLNIIGSLTGHIVYGLVLGFTARFYVKRLVSKNMHESAIISRSRAIG